MGRQSWRASGPRAVGRRVMSMRFSLTQIGVIGPSGQLWVSHSRSSTTASVARVIPDAAHVARQGVQGLQGVSRHALHEPERVGLVVVGAAVGVGQPPPVTIAQAEAEVAGGDQRQRAAQAPALDAPDPVDRRAQAVIGAVGLERRGALGELGHRRRHEHLLRVPGVEALAGDRVVDGDPPRGVRVARRGVRDGLDLGRPPPPAAARPGRSRRPRPRARARPGRPSPSDARRSFVSPSPLPRRLRPVAGQSPPRGDAGARGPVAVVAAIQIA